MDSTASVSGLYRKTILRPSFSLLAKYIWLSNSAKNYYDEDGNLIDGYDEEDLRDANLSQELEFPRGTDTVVPDSIKFACWEITHALLDGVDPDLELENLGVVSQGLASVRTTYNRNHTQIEHIKNGIPSAAAWRYLRPFLRDGDAIKFSRVD